MRAGVLRHRIIIQQPTITRDTHGGVVTSWSTWATVWAAIEPLRGREFWEAQQANSEIQGKVIIRHRPGLSPTMRVLWGSRILHILAIVTPEERPIETHLLYKESSE